MEGAAFGLCLFSFCRIRTCPRVSAAGNLSSFQAFLNFLNGFYPHPHRHCRRRRSAAGGVFVGYLWWLSNQGPVLARSDDHDPLTGITSQHQDESAARPLDREGRQQIFARDCGTGIATTCFPSGSTTTTRNMRSTFAVRRRSTRCSRGNWWIGKRRRR